jgi:Tfp pilus assembly protein PilE
MKRRGMLLLEMAVAGVLLLALTTLCVKYITVTAVQRQALEQRQTALFEASNMMERFAAKKYSDLTSETISKTTLSSQAESVLPNGEIKIELADIDAKPAAKRIAITIRWKDRNGLWTQPVRLVAWRYKP